MGQEGDESRRQQEDAGKTQQDYEPDKGPQSDAVEKDH